MEKFMKLKEYKGITYHYFKDENGSRQGEFKLYHPNGQLRIHSYYKDGKLYGEYKQYYSNGPLEYKKYYLNDKDVTDMYNKLQAWKSL